MKILRNLLFAATAIFATGCALVEDYPQLDESKLPVASDLVPDITVDNETGMVTFAIENKDVTPVWNFADIVIDGAKVSGKQYKGEVTLLINEPGEHEVELKGYNAHGISVGSQMVPFTTTIYIPYEKGLPGWDPDEGVNLWKTANKEIFWYYAPGWAEIAAPAVETTADGYKMTLEQATTAQWQAQFAFKALGISTSAGKKYDFQVVIKSNVAHPGVTVKLTDAADDDTFYFADRHEIPANRDFVYQVANFDGKDIADLSLFFDFGGNPENNVMEIKQIIICEHMESHVVKEGAVAEKWDAGIDANIWLNAAPTMAIWFADNDWSPLTVTVDDVFAKNDDGTYTITMPEGMGATQWQGQVHFENTGLATSAAKKYDFQVVLKSTEDHPGVTIKLSKQGDDATFYCEVKAVLKAGEEYIYQLANVDGIDIDDIKFTLDVAGGVAGSTLTVSDLLLCEHQEGHTVPEPPVEEWFVEDAVNMWLNAAPTMAIWFADNDWSPLTVTVDDVFAKNDDGTYTITMPEGMGATQWQGQVHFENTGLATSAAKKYDFQVVLKSTEDHPGVTIKLSKQGDDATFYCEVKAVLKAGEEYIYQLANVDGIDIDDIKFTLDVAGGVAGSTITVSNVILAEAE